MIYFLQIENRKDELLQKLCLSVKKQAEKFGKYILSENKESIAKKFAPKNAKHLYNYSKMVMLFKYVKELKKGDWIIYLDSDIYAKSFKGMLKYMLKSHKQIFLVSLFTGAVNSAFIGIKITPEIKNLFKKMPHNIQKQTRLNRYGEERATSDEEIFNFQIENNINGFNMYTDFLDTSKYCSIPQKEIFGQRLDYMQITSKTQVLHFMGEEKTLAYKYCKKQLDRIKP